jgi:hypothetical protein
MTPEAKKKPGLIDSYRKLQKKSSDEVEKFTLEGLLYDIDVTKDFSSIHIRGQPIMDMPVTSIIEYLNSLELERESYNTNISLAKQSQQSIDFLEALDEAVKIKKPKKCKKKKSKKKTEEEKKKHKEFIDGILTSWKASDKFSEMWR